MTIIHPKAGSAPALTPPTSSPALRESVASRRGKRAEGLAGVRPYRTRNAMESSQRDSSAAAGERFSFSQSPVWRSGTSR
jgi:hypothetical protein